MSVWIIHDPQLDRACLWDSCRELPFGPGFIGDSAREQAESFLAWLGVDHPQHCLDAELLDEAHSEWVRTHLDDSGDLRDVPLADDHSRAMLGRLQQAEHEHERRTARRWHVLGTGG